MDNYNVTLYQYQAEPAVSSSSMIKEFMNIIEEGNVTMMEMYIGK